MPIRKDVADLLAFQIKKSQMINFNGLHLTVGMICVWVVGMGRWWDNAAASSLQKSGIGSIVYVLVLSIVIFTVGLATRNPEWKFKVILTYVCLTAIPGIVYAFPIEQWFSANNARDVNIVFLGVVATWRIGLLWVLFRRLSESGWFTSVLFTMLIPGFVLVAVYITGLIQPNFTEAMIRGMGGLRNAPVPSKLETAVEVVVASAFYGFLPLMLAFLISAAHSVKKRGNKKRSNSGLNENPT